MISCFHVFWCFPYHIANVFLAIALGYHLTSYLGSAVGDQLVNCVVAWLGRVLIMACQLRKFARQCHDYQQLHQPSRLLPGCSAV